MSAISDDTPSLNPSLWVDNYGDYLYRYTYYRVQDSELAGDIVQETLLAALKSAKAFAGTSSEKTWLTSILKRKIADYYRSKYRGTATESREELADDEDFMDEGPYAGHWKRETAPKDWGPTPDEAAEQTELKSILEKCLQALKPTMQQVIRMKELDNYSTEEICDILGISESNSWVLIHRARKQLRKCLEKNYFT